MAVRKNGRMRIPRSQDTQLIRDLTGRIALGLDVRTACVLSGINTSTYYSRLRTDSVFAAKIAEAEAVRENRYLSVISRAALVKRDWRAASWILEKLMPRRYGPRRQDDDNGGAADGSTALSGLTEEQLQKVLQDAGRSA
jgi:hypothetical protein